MGDLGIWSHGSCLTQAPGISAPGWAQGQAKGITSPRTPQDIPLHRTLSSSTQEGAPGAIYD